MNISHERLKARIGQLAGELLSAEANQSSLITVTSVELTERGARAIVLLSVLPREHEKKALAFAQRKRGDLAALMRKRLSLRMIPQLSFAIDEGEKQRQRIEELSQSESEK